MRINLKLLESLNQPRIMEASAAEFQGWRITLKAVFPEAPPYCIQSFRKKYSVNTLGRSSLCYCDEQGEKIWSHDGSTWHTFYPTELAQLYSLENGRAKECVHYVLRKSSSAICIATATFWCCITFDRMHTSPSLTVYIDNHTQGEKPARKHHTQFHKDMHE